MTAFSKFEIISKQNNSNLCIGIDPDPKKIPALLGEGTKGVLKFIKNIIDSTKDIACAFKLNFAFFEQFGAEGFEVLKNTFDYIPDELFKIADAKRGDIGNTSAAYAKSIFEYFNADAVTLNPYMGKDSIKPFLEYENKMSLILSLTSNPSSSDFQRLVSGGKPIYKHVVETATDWADRDRLGFIAGATHPEEIHIIRQAAIDRLLLIPGIGTQGGEIDSALKANMGGPAIFNISRAIIYSSSDNDFADKAREKAIFFRKLLNK